VTHNATGEVVSGMVIMRKGGNARRVIAGAEDRMEEIRRGLPEGVDVLVFYDQSRLVDRTTDTLRKNLLLGGTLVIMVIWGFLRNFPASLIVALLIPFSMLWAFTAMRWWGFSANLMSLGALDFGLLVDGGVVMTENVMRRAEEAEEGADHEESREPPGSGCAWPPWRWGAPSSSGSPSWRWSTSPSSPCRGRRGRCSPPWPSWSWPPSWAPWSWPSPSSRRRASPS
jgi:hypothetical protein